MADAVITRDYIIEKITAWENRIVELFDMVEEWAASRPEWNVERGRVTQRAEQLMNEHNVMPRELPTLNLYRNRYRVSFVPSALWVVGADGRINIVTNDRLYILVDRRHSDSHPSDWQFTTIPNRPRTAPFTRDEFLGILDENI